MTITFQKMHSLSKSDQTNLNEVTNVQSQPTSH